MAKKFHIVVEGKEDKLFMEKYLKYINLSSSVPECIKDLDGINNLGRHALKINLGGHIPKMLEHLREDITVLIVADANSCHTKRREYIEKVISDKIKGFNVPLSLLPDNQSTGALEDLLEQIILSQHESIFACFEDYKQCLASQKYRYTPPNLKAKIYSYKEAIGTLVRGKPFDPQYWDFDHRALNPLKRFLTENINTRASI